MADAAIPLCREWTPEEPSPLERRSQEEGGFLMWRTVPYFSLYAEYLYEVGCQIGCPPHASGAITRKNDFDKAGLFPPGSYDIEDMPLYQWPSIVLLPKASA